jgi:hypothetical protein
MHVCVYFAVSFVTFLLSLLTLKYWTPSPTRDIAKQLKFCKADLITIITKTKCHPILLRLAWSDAGE